MEIESLRVMRMMRELLPTSTDISNIRRQIECITPVKTLVFAGKEHVFRETCLYYLLSHNILAFTKVITFEEIKSIYFGTSKEYSSFGAVYSPVLVIKFGNELDNKNGQQILNTFLEHVQADSQCVILYATGGYELFYARYLKGNEYMKDVTVCKFDATVEHTHGGGEARAAQPPAKSGSGNNNFSDFNFI